MLNTSFRPQIARRFQFRHPFVAQMSRFCAIRGTSAFFQLICCNLDRTDKKRTCSAHLSNKWMPEMESLGDLRSKTLCPTCLFGWSSAVTRLLATLQCESIWTHELAGTRESKANRCSGVNDRVEKSVLDRKSHVDSNSGIHLLLRWADFALFAEPEPISSLFAAI